MKSFICKSFIGLCALALSGVAVATPPFMPGQVVVKSDTQAEKIEGYEVIKKLPQSGLLVLQVERGKEFGQAIKLRKKGVAAYPNYIANASAYPLDPFYNPYQWHLPAIQSEQAWDVTKGAYADGNPVRVAVLDTGIVYGGADGVNLCADGHYDVVNLDNTPSDGSQLSHGTHVAGTISQITTFSGEGATGVAGVAPEACVVVVKVLDDRGSGTFADIAEGIRHAVNEAGAQVINMSLGVNAEAEMYSDPIVDPELQNAEANNVLVVAAAGNDGYQKNVSYPAIYPTVVAVGATGFGDYVVDYSNRGDGLDIVAPGGDTSVDANGDGYSDGVLQETKYRNKFGYHFLQGTSMASPHVAGVAALMLAHNFSSTDEVRNALYTSTKDLYQAGFDKISGHGLLQSYDALLAGGEEPTETSLTVPTGLSPADEYNIGVDTVFDWNAVDGAHGYIISIGVDLTNPEFEDDVSSTTYDPETNLSNYATTYDWSVRAYVKDDAGNIVDSATATASFETEPAPDESGGGCVPTANNEKGPRGNDGIDNDCDDLIDGDDPF